MQKQVDYVYDVFGNTISRTVTISGISTTQKFAYDVSGASIGIKTHINPIWADLDASGNIVTRYLTDDSGTRLARTGSTGTFWLLTDRLGSVRDVLNSSGSLVDQVSYDISGNITSETDQTITGEWGFGGSRIDRALNMPMDGYRFVLPDGQFSGVDELGFAAGDPNTRRPMGNNGANSTDPSGLDTIIRANGRGNTMVVSYKIKDETTFLGIIVVIDGVGYVVRTIPGSQPETISVPVKKLEDLAAGDDGRKTIDEWHDWFREKGRLHSERLESSYQNLHEMRGGSVSSSFEQSRTLIIQGGKQVGATGGEMILQAAAGPLLATAFRYLKRAKQGFKSFDAYKRAFPTPEGKVWHHIVEQRGPNVERFGAEAIHNTQNLVPVSPEVNQAIANYFSSIQSFTNRMTLRQWLGSQSFADQHAFGQRILNLMLRGQPLPH